MIVAYIYDKNGTALTQIYNPAGLSMTQKMNQVGEAVFKLPNTHPDCRQSVLQNMNRIIIKKETTEWVSTYFEWVISSIVPSLYETMVNCRDKLHILELQTLASDYTGTSTIVGILNTILNAINALDNTGITLSCDVTTSKSYSFTTTTTFLGALRDLTEWLEFRVVGDVLEVKTALGVDISTSVEFRYDMNNLGDRNIADANVEDDSKNIANDVTVKGATGTHRVTDSASIAKYGRIAVAFSVSGDQVTEANTILAERKDGARNVTIQPMSNDFFLANIGDTVAIEIITTTDLLDFAGTIRVIEKRLDAGDTDRVKYVLWNNKNKTKNFIEKQREIDDRLKKVELL